MIISCPSCSIKYFVNKEVLLKKTKLKCSDCGHEWVYNYKLESSIKNQNNELEGKILRLTAESLDLDYLEEQLKLNTATFSENELIINLKK